MLYLLVQNFRDSKELDAMIARQNVIYGSMRGTAPFWARQQTRITHMVAALGPPTAFATFSSADTRWEDMEAFLSSYV